MYMMQLYAMLSKREIWLLKTFDDYYVEISCLALLSEFLDTPKSCLKAKQSGNCDMWNKARKGELNAVKEDETWGKSRDDH